jgi:hypothetical protein
MSYPSLGVFELQFFIFSFELSGPFDEHQEQNARHEAGRFILSFAVAVAR